MLTHANNVRIGDIIQHPSKFWPKKEVLDIQNIVLSNDLLFTVPSIMNKNETTTVRFRKDSKILIHNRGE